MNWGAQKSGGVDFDAGRAGAGFGSNHDFHVVAEAKEKAHKPFHGETFKLVVQQSRDLGLIDFKGGCNLDLRKTATFDDAMDGGSKTGSGVEFGVGEVGVILLWGEERGRGRPRYSRPGGRRYIPIRYFHIDVYPHHSS
jgi:hypothetical protein